MNNVIVDTTAYPKKSLMSLIKLNEELKRNFCELDNWEDMLYLIDKTFIYTEEQVSFVKDDFLKRRAK